MVNLTGDATVPSIHVTVHSDTGEELVTLGLKPGTTVADLQLELESICGVPVKQQLLTANSTEDRPRCLDAAEGLLETRTVTLTSFAALIPSALASSASPCRMAATEQRGIQRGQLHRLLDFLQRRCDAGGEMRFPWRHASGPLRLQHLNLYHLADWVLRPATRADRCSYVELISEEPEAQMPKWFVSHAWQEAILDFITCLDGHGAVRQLGTEAAYWVCAYANNQHELGNDLHSNPRETSFFRAMQLCCGVLLILDPLATPFSRVWCCFELATAMTSHFERAENRLLLDIATVRDELPEVLTDGLTMHEEQQENAVCAGRGGKEKAKREERFPIELAQKALALDIAAASASRDLDKIRILNSIAGLAEDRLDEPLPDPLPTARLQRYRAVDQALRCVFALASVSQVVSKDLKEMMPDICRALHEVRRYPKVGAK
eukprot:s282_g40.t3